MKKALPGNAKIAKDAKETVQECVSEFISFITSEWVFCAGFGATIAGRKLARVWKGPLHEGTTHVHVP